MSPSPGEVHVRHGPLVTSSPSDGRRRARGRHVRGGRVSPGPGWGYPDLVFRDGRLPRGGPADSRPGHPGAGWRGGAAARTVRPWTCGSSLQTGVRGARRTELEALLDGPGLVWIDVKYWDADTAAALAKRLNLHDRAVHDCAVRNPVAKVHTYPDQAFVVLHAPERGARGHVHFVELDQFVGPELAAHRARADEPGRRARRRLRRDLDGRPPARRGDAATRPGLRAVGRAGQRARRPDARLPHRADPGGVGAGAAGHRRARGRHGAVPRGAVRGPARAARGGDDGRDEPRGVRADGACRRSSATAGAAGLADLEDQFRRIAAMADGSASTCRA